MSTDMSSVNNTNRIEVITGVQRRYLGSQDTFYVGTLKGVGRVYQQTFVDTYSKWAAAKLYTTKTPITSADLLNDRVLPFFAEQGMGVIRILTDRGTEFCGKAESHDYQLYLALNDIEHTKTKVMHPQTNGICERFRRLPFLSNKAKIETSVPIGARNEKVEIYGKSDCGHFGRR